MRPFLSLYMANFFLVGGTGLLTTYLALYLQKNDASTLFIGGLTSVYYLGLLLGSKVGIHFIIQVGHIRTFAASTAIVTACVAAHGVTDNIYLWLTLRLVVGIGMMSNYMVLESWLNEQASNEQRGQVFSLYMITSYLGMVGGQYMLSNFPELGLPLLFLICILLSIGIVPISITRRIHPKPVKPIELSLMGYFKQIPQSLTAITFAGVITGSFYGLAPVYASQAGFNAEGIAYFMSVTVLAGLLAQWPIGFLSDRIRRSILLRSSAVIIGLVSLLIVMLPFKPNTVYLLTFIFGVFAFTLYPLASALANSRVSDEDRVGVSSALLVAFGAGAGIGSTALAQMMDKFGYQALYVAIAVLTLLMFVALTVINATQKRETPEPSDYVVIASDITTSPLAASMDPRIEEELAQEQLLIVDDEEYTEMERSISKDNS